MTLLISLSLALAPALILLVYYYRKDKQRPEPKGLILKIFFLGIVSTVPAIILELLLRRVEGVMAGMPLMVAFFRAFIIAGLCEEWIKLQVVKKFAYKNRFFDEAMDGIIYTVVASLGFACLENVMYVINYGIEVALLRAFTAVPMHAFASGIMGYYVGMAKFNRESEGSLIAKGLLIAIMIHGLYDFMLFSTQVFISQSDSYLGIIPGLLIFPLLIITFFVLRSKIKSALKDDAVHGRVGG